MRLGIRTTIHSVGAVALTDRLRIEIPHFTKLGGSGISPHAVGKAAFKEALTCEEATTSGAGSLESITQRWPRLRQIDQSLIELFFPSHCNTGQNKVIYPNNEICRVHVPSVCRLRRSLSTSGVLDFRQRKCECRLGCSLKVSLLQLRSSAQDILAGEG